MKRLVFVVEGRTEVIFVDNVIIPYINSRGFNISITCQTITTNRKLNKKGGGNSYILYKNEIIRTLNSGNTLVTSLIDFYALGTDFPNYSTNNIDSIENGISEDINNSFFLPYIQKHELEALFFSNISIFKNILENYKSFEALSSIIAKYPNPEDINNSKITAPSKRLENIFVEENSTYLKTYHGDLIAKKISIEVIFEKCPRFKNWIENLVNFLNSFGLNKF